MERLNTLRQQQLPAVDAACKRLEAVLQADPYLQQRLVSVTVEAHNKALYSLHKCVLLQLFPDEGPMLTRQHVQTLCS